MEKALLGEATKNIDHLIRELSKLNVSTEADFLAIGGCLNDLSAKALDIKTVASSSLNLLCGEKMEDDIDRLRQIMDKMTMHLTNSSHEVEVSAKVLRNTMGKLEEVSCALPGFKKVIKHLQILAVSTKIESARLTINDKGFSTLAEDVSRLSEITTIKLSQVVASLDVLHDTISEALSQILVQDAAERAEALVILDGITSGLSVLLEKYTLSSTAMQKLALSTEEIYGDIGQIVTSIQFHDITRQQIEHVQDTLKEQRAACEVAGEDDLSLHHIGDICELQAHQLSNSLSELSSAIEGSVENLYDITERVQGISQEISTLLQGNSSSSFLSELNQGISTVIAYLTKNVRTNHELFAAVSSVISTMAELSGFVDDIEETGSEIELIALNARVKAAQVAKEGASLDVIAEAIRDLSNKARLETRSIAEVLTKISAASAELSDETERRLQENTNLDDTVALTDTLLASFSHTNGRVAAILKGLQEESARLTKDIAHLIETITVHEKTEKTLKQAIDELTGVAEQFRGSSPPANALTRAEHLRELEQRYTMQNERKVHRSFFGSRSPLPKKKPEEPVSRELGDNVELF